jgi:arylsulfatase A-like enzyme
VDWNKLSTKGDNVGHRVILEGETLRATQAGYFGLIEHLDEQIRPLIADFKERSMKAGRPWVIVVTSDHGEGLGDHGFFRKCEPYEGEANIPFLIAASAELAFQPGLRSEQPVCLEDIMPTLLHLAGAPCPKLMDGINLTPVLRGKTEKVRDWLHSEHAPCYSQAQAFHALTDGRFKYIWRPLDGSEQLFDLKKDPREEHDLAKMADKGGRVQEWRARLIKLLANRPEGFSDGKKLIAGRPYPALQAVKANN